MLLILTGCANSSSTGTSPTSTPSASPSPSQSATVAPASLTCTPSQLMIERGLEGGAAGSVGITGMGFKNISTTPCTLKGYPILQMLDATGHSLPTYVTHANSFDGSAEPAKVITLAPGLDAKFDMIYPAQTGYGNAKCPTSSQVEITAPGVSKSEIISWKIQPYGGSTIQTLRCGEIRISPVYAP